MDATAQLDERIEALVPDFERDEPTDDSTTYFKANEMPVLGVSGEGSSAVLLVNVGEPAVDAATAHDGVSAVDQRLGGGWVSVPAADLDDEALQFWVDQAQNLADGLVVGSLAVDDEPTA